MTMDAPYNIALLSEYTYTLDSLPIDLSRNFADLRELDAVLSSTVVSITTKIETLTSMIEQGAASKQDKLWLLTEIAQEAQRLRMGGEDKIRVACQAADNLKGHSNHLRALSEHLPNFNTATLDRKTTYPHISERSYMPPMAIEGGRRRRGQALLTAQAAASANGHVDPSPAKRKRIQRDDDVDMGMLRSPKKPTNADANARARNNGRAKKTERGASPSESILSVTSHLPQQQSGARAGGSSAGQGQRAGNTSMGNNKRRTGAAAHQTNRTSTPLVHEVYNAHDAHGHANGSSRRGGNVSDIYNVPPSSGHPSLPQPYNGAGGSGQGHIGYPVASAGQDWGLAHTQQLEGPGMPVARSSSIHPASNANADSHQDTPDGGDGDGDGDADDKTYCFCNGPSYGEMIGCDGDGCEREWFHLPCLGLTTPPEGTWLCKACEGKQRTSKRVNNRTGKRKATGGARTAKS